MTFITKTLDKAEDFWDSLDRKIVVNKREMYLVVIAVALGAFVLGMLLSPRKNTVIGSNNANNKGIDKSGDLDDYFDEDDYDGEEMPF